MAELLIFATISLTKICLQYYFVMPYYSYNAYTTAVYYNIIYIIIYTLVHMSYSYFCINVYLGRANYIGTKLFLQISYNNNIVLSDNISFEKYSE